MVTETASASEAAAVVAALEQFLAETDPAPPAAGSPQSPWQQAALREGISARTDLWPAARAARPLPES